MLTMKNIQQTIGQMQAPLGRDAKNPGRSCRDIYLAAISNGESPKQGQGKYRVLLCTFNKYVTKFKLVKLN